MNDMNAMKGLVDTVLFSSESPTGDGADGGDDGDKGG